MQPVAAEAAPTRGGAFRETFPAACNAAYSASPNSRERTRKRTPSPFSSENMPPRPGTTSMISWVCFQYSNCEALI